MAARDITDLTSMQRLLPEFRSALQSFTDSSSKFRILQTISPHSSTSSFSSPSTTTPATPQTLYVLDSSFNPPTLAHHQIATSALHHDHGHPPKRLLLLLATHNADKAPKPAPFEHRLVMMTIFAHDLLARLAPPVAIDIAVTTEPYFHDKALAIASSGTYPSPQPEQVYLTGYDTLLRLLDPKYYAPTHTLAPLGPFLARHRVRVTYRTGSGWGGRSEQERCLRELGEGGREEEGGRREWVQRIEMVEGGEEEVSSTGVREAVGSGDRGVLGRLVCGGVGEWILGEGLYGGVE